LEGIKGNQGILGFPKAFGKKFGLLLFPYYEEELYLGNFQKILILLGRKHYLDWPWKVLKNFPNLTKKGGGILRAWLEELD